MGVSKEERLAKKLAELEKNEEKKKKLLSQIKFLQKPTKTERKKERDARTHRLCTLAGTVEKVEGKEFPLEANGKMDSFEKYYRDLLEKSKETSAVDETAKNQFLVGKVVEEIVGKITDINAWRDYIMQYQGYIRRTQGKA